MATLTKDPISGAYVVKAGDSLSKIASNQGRTLAELLATNPQYAANPNLIRPGDVVKVGSSAAPSYGALTAPKTAASSPVAGLTTPSPLTVTGGSADKTSFTQALIDMLKEAQGTDQVGQAKLLKQGQDIKGLQLADSERIFENGNIAPDRGTALGLSAQGEFDPASLSIENQQRLASQNLGNITDLIDRTQTGYDKEQDRKAQLAADAADNAFREKQLAETIRSNKSSEAITRSKNTSTSGPSSQYKTDLDAIIGATIATIPSKFGQEQFAAQLAKARNDADRISLVASVVLKNAPAEVKLDFANQAVGVSNLDKAISVIDAGAKTGVLNNTKQYIFNLAGQDFDPQLAQIQAYITSAIQPYRNTVTGAAWGPQEEAEYQSLFGSTKFSPQELKDRLTRVKEILKDKSSQGLNVYVNPLGTYDNQFQTGNLTPTSTTGANNSSSASKFDYLLPSITVKGSKAYLPRASWAPLSVADKNALLAESQADGYELLIN